VIDKQGVIRYAFVNEDYTKRAAIPDILAALKQLN
jgi:peroxiredoxin